MKQKKIKNIIILSLIIFVTLETYFHLAFPDILKLAKIIKISDDPILGHELLPNSKTKFDGTNTKIATTLIEISSQGLRDKFYNLQKNSNSKRIVFLGDSFVFGLGTDYKNTIPKRLEILLNRKSSCEYEVINCGVFGYNLIQEIEFLKERVLKFNPDIIIFLITGNDADKEITFSKNKLANLIFQFSYTYRVICYRFDEYLRKSERKNENKDYLIRVQKIYTSFKQLKQYLNNNQEVLLVVKNFSPWMQGLTDICKNEGFQILDFTSLFKYYGDKILIYKDGHFNPWGTNLIAQEIYNFLNSNLMP